MKKKTHKTLTHTHIHQHGKIITRLFEWKEKDEFFFSYCYWNFPVLFFLLLISFYFAFSVSNTTFSDLFLSNIQERQDIYFYTLIIIFFPFCIQRIEQQRKHVNRFSSNEIVLVFSVALLYNISIVLTDIIRNSITYCRNRIIVILFTFICCFFFFQNCISQINISKYSQWQLKSCYRLNNFLKYIATELTDENRMKKTKQHPKLIYFSHLFSCTHHNGKLKAKYTCTFCR